MNLAILDRAIEALTKVGAARNPKRQVGKPMKREDNQRSTTSVPEVSRIDLSHSEQSALCGAPHCAGCYEVDPGVRIHPPKSGEEWKEWLLRWEPKGKVQ
jgi:hypothetical protein